MTVCVDYSDIFSEVIAYNQPMFDRWVIITSERDEKTRDLCHRHNLETFVTNDFYREGRAFDKGRAIDRGMQMLSHREAVVHLDADIAVPGHFRNTLGFADLLPDTIYGCDRIMVRGPEQWDKLRQSGWLEADARSHHYTVRFPKGFDVGARWADPVHGWTPIGFFSLAFRDSIMRKGIRHRRYSSYGHSDSSRTDVQYSLQWDRPKRVLIPELIVAHLETEENAPLGQNWKGRKSRPFGAACPAPY